MSYKGLALIGCDRLAGIYGVDEGIVDAKGTGIQHLFFDGFERDLIHSAVTLVRDGGRIFYGNRSESVGQHPVHARPEESGADHGYVFRDRFACGGFDKTDVAVSWGDANLGFECTVADREGRARDIEVYAYVITNLSAVAQMRREGDRVLATGDRVAFVLHHAGADRSVLLEEGPTGFVYRTTSQILHDRGFGDAAEIRPEMHAGILLGRKVHLPANGEVRVRWTLRFARSADELVGFPGAADPVARARDYWEAYLAAGHPLAGSHEALDRSNQVAIKSAVIGGFVPADLTGHYYAGGLPCYYARDALMVARAFLLSGHVDEARDVMRVLLGRPRKETGEFFQRYDGRGAPSEGANNNVPRQLDSIGYMLWLVRAFERRTGERLLPDDTILALARVIVEAEKKNGLAGPEGGVNEGVFGPAFIVSSNMCIYGGLRAAVEMLGDPAQTDGIERTCDGILAGIEGTFVARCGYRYGYVSYHDDLVMKYDTPQYFGPLFGFDDTENMRATHRALLQSASFDTDGIGYSEQEYHHGPWTFNTAACAQYARLIGDDETRSAKLDWLERHANAYGQMPEAFSADDMSQCYINPLVWACGEVVSALHFGETPYDV